MKLVNFNEYWVFVEINGRQQAITHEDFISRGGKLPVKEDKKAAAKKAIKEAKADGVITKEEARDIADNHSEALDEMFEYYIDKDNSGE